jgi:quercetin dioxygenase-like cupin family protein
LSAPCRVRRAALLALVTTTTLAAATPEEIRLTPSEIETMAKGGAGAGTSGVAGIRTTTLQGNPAAAGPYTIAIHVPSNTRIAAHSHRDARSAVVVSGTWYFGYGSHASDDGVKSLAPGSYYTEPANQPHFAQTRDQPAVVYITGFGPTDTRYVEAVADPRKP